jgi:uncharacterized protein (DUF1778 family)
MPPSKTAPKRRKTIRKTEVIRIRVTTEQKAGLTAAAERDGSGLSAWLLRAGLHEMRNAEKDGSK